MFWTLEVGLGTADRLQYGTKASLVVEGQSGLLGVSTALTNWHDVRCLEDALPSAVIERPECQEEHLLLDKGVDNPISREAPKSLGSIAHIRTIRPETRPRLPGHRKPRRWVVERTLALLRKCRGILVRYNKRAANYLGLLQLACALI